MSIKLSVYQIPPTLTNEEFTISFRDLKGFLDARLTYNEKINQIIGELEFISYESADQAKKLMQSYKFPGATSGIIIQFNTIQSHQNQLNTLQQQQNTLQQQQQNNTLQQSTVSQLDNSNNFYHNQSNNFLQQQPLMSQQQQFVFGSGGQVGHHHQQSLHQQQQPNIALQQQQQQPNITIQQQQQQQLGNTSSSNSGNGLNALVSNLLFQVPPNATNSLYIDGVPIDATHREVAHIFRPFPGYKAVRLIKKQTQSGREYYYCFADFENSIQSTIALQTLQSYRFDKKHRKSLKIMYANDPQKSSTNMHGNKSYKNQMRNNNNSGSRRIYKKR